jgi:predicted NBD/HSP70 family sugar kinase
MNEMTPIPPMSPAAVAVLSMILTHGPIARIEVARMTGLSQAAVTKAVAPLMASGYVAEAEVDREDLPIGRPVSPLIVVPERAFSLGIKVTADEVIGVITDLHARIRSIVHERLESSDVDTVIASIERIVGQLVALHPDQSGRIAGVGVTVSGDVDSHFGIVRHSPRLGWRNVALAELLRARLDLPIVVENDVRALTIAEQWFGLGVDAQSFAVVTIGSGIGCGIYVNGDVVEGASGVSGEIGHLPLAPGNLVCTCGRRGCVETIASSRAILERVRASTGNEALDMDSVLELAHGGDQHAHSAFSDAGDVIGSALAAMVNLVGPELVVIAGEGVTDFDLYEERIRATFSEHAFGAASECQLVVRSHTFDDWARGGAVTVIRNLVRGGAHATSARAGGTRGL